jgi:phosphomannomutase
MCADVLSEAGLNVVDCGELPTPALAGFAWASHSAALMVTGSHIPADRNGIKFFLPGAEILPLGRTSHFVAVDTEAVPPETIHSFAAWTKEHGLDAIISTDGDGDRPLIADETGTQLRGDVVGLVTARMVGADVVVTPVTSNSGINVGLGFEVLRTKVGSPFVLDAMERAAGDDRTIVGFEANGGFILGSPFDRDGIKGTALPTRDALLPILAVLQSARQEKIALSALAARWALPVAASDRLENFPVERSQALMAHLTAHDDALKQFLAPLGEVVSVDRTDGLRSTFSSGEIVHLRPSGNAPEMRCYAEAATSARVEALMGGALDLVRRFRA